MPAIPIRPWKIFELVTGGADDRIGSVPLPHRHSVMLSLETLVIVALVRHFKPRRSFEFGTFRGETTIAIAANLPEDGTIFTLDLAPEDLPHVPLGEFDAGLARTALADPPKYVGTSLAPKVHEVRCDSMKLDESAYSDMDFILVDGNHDLPFVKSDTKKSLAMLASRGCIVWHDYGPLAESMAVRVNTSPEPFAGITRYLDQLELDRPIYHVQDTRLAIYSAAFDW